MPTGDVSLAIGYWIVSHKTTLKRWWAIGLLAVIVFATVWVIVSMSVFFAQETKVTTRIADSAAAVAVYTPAHLGVPAALRLGGVSIIRRDDQRGDMVAFLTNTNTVWGAVNIMYHFTVGSTTTPQQTVTVNPGESRPVMALNQTIGTESTGRIVLDRVGWTRGSATAIKPVFTTESVTWDPTRVTIAGVVTNTVSVRATLRNASVYNFYHVDVPVVAYAGDEVVAVDELRLDTWATNTTKTLSVSWPFPVTGVTRVDLLPTVNMFDSSNRF